MILPNVYTHGATALVEIRTPPDTHTGLSFAPGGWFLRFWMVAFRRAWTLTAGEAGAGVQSAWSPWSVPPCLASEGGGDRATSLDVASTSLHPERHLSLWFLWQRTWEIPNTLKAAGSLWESGPKGKPLALLKQVFIKCLLHTLNRARWCGKHEMKRMLDPYPWGVLWFRETVQREWFQAEQSAEWKHGVPCSEGRKVLLKVFNRKPFPFFSLSWLTVFFQLLFYILLYIILLLC